MSLFVFVCLFSQNLEKWIETQNWRNFEFLGLGLRLWAWQWAQKIKKVKSVTWSWKEIRYNNMVIERCKWRLYWGLPWNFPKTCKLATWFLDKSPFFMLDNLKFKVWGSRLGWIFIIFRREIFLRLMWHRNLL